LIFAAIAGQFCPQVYQRSQGNANQGYSDRTPSHDQKIPPVELSSLFYISITVSLGWIKASK